MGVCSACLGLRRRDRWRWRGRGLHVPHSYAGVNDVGLVMVSPRGPENGYGVSMSGDLLPKIEPW
jgi:hypothetical protein